MRRAAPLRWAGQAPPLLYLAVVLAAVASGVWYVLSQPERVAGHAFAVPSRGSIVVEVLNGSGRTGLARAATRALRRNGIDVVLLGNAPRADSTRVVLRRGSAGRAKNVRDALGQGVIAIQLDSTRHVDVTVVLGLDYRPPDEVHP